MIDYSKIIDDVHEYLADYNPTNKRKLLIKFDDMIADMKSIIVTELFLRGRKHNISLLFTSQSYFKVPKSRRLHAAHYCVKKIPTKRELQQIASNHSSAIDFKDFMKLYKDRTKEPYSFLRYDTT